ncbi:DUF5368 family protein [Elioraea sp.]|uniref:DUF5368 family protein n=1 Tax=Elioraea sp. TaxID=2185103 RepID=UPI003F72F367
MELFAPRALAAIIGEMFGGLLWIAAVIAVLALALLVVGLWRGVRWRLAVRIAAAFGALVAAGVLAALPGFTNAAHADLSGALDWLTWAAVGIGAGIAAALAVLPLLALALGQRADEPAPTLQRGAASSLR